jgi:hypothetical protein
LDQLIQTARLQYIDNVCEDIAYIGFAPHLYPDIGAIFAVQNTGWTSVSPHFHER